MVNENRLELNVPKIDISSLVSVNSDVDAIRKTVEEIGKACRNWGFFYVVGHKIPSESIQKIHELSRDFFYKPKEFKDTVARSAENFRGFTDSELTKQQLDWKEAFDFGTESEDINAMNSDFDGNNRWPDGMAEFKSAMVEYFEALHDISAKLMSAIFSSLNEIPERFQNDFSGSRVTSFLRLNYYPVCPTPTTHLGVGPHSDSGALTILWQDMGVSSLQVEKDNVFYDVYPVADSFVVNIGDMTQVWSNGLYKAPVHRVLANHEKERFSSPLFYNPSYSCIVQPLDSCLTEKSPAKYLPIHFGEFRKGRFAGDYADYGEEVQIKHYEVGGSKRWNPVEISG